MNPTSRALSREANCAVILFHYLPSVVVVFIGGQPQRSYDSGSLSTRNRSSQSNETVRPHSS